MMVKPPIDSGRRRVFEINDCVLVAVKISFVEQRASAMHQPTELKLCVVVDALLIEAGKQGGGRRAIKTFVVIKDSDFHSALFHRFFSSKHKSITNDIPGLFMSSGGDSRTARQQLFVN
jgi:hypothetical protein